MDLNACFGGFAASLPIILLTHQYGKFEISFSDIVTEVAKLQFRIKLSSVALP